MARLLGTFTLYLIAVTLVGLLVNEAIGALIGISALGSAIAIIAQLLAAMWSGALHARRTMYVPDPRFIWRASFAMTAILGLLWTAIVLSPVLWGELLSAAVVHMISTAAWVLAVAGLLITVISVLGTRYVLVQSIRSVVEEQDRKVRETF